jgi:hypothetical protein
MAQEIKGAALPALCVELNGGRIDRQNPQAQGATPGAPQLIMSWFQPPAPRFVWSASYIRTQGKIALLEDGHYIWEDSDRRRIASQSSVPIADMRDRPTNY